MSVFQNLTVGDLTVTGSLTTPTDATPFAGDLSITGTTTSSGDLTVGSNFVVTAASGNLAINTNKFTVAASSGNTVIAGTASVGSTLNSVGNFSVATTNFTVAAANGNTAIAGTLGVTGAATLSSTLGVTGNMAVNTDKFTVAASSGNTIVAGTLGVTGDVAVNTNKFTVTASSGNTAVAGTMAVTGKLTATKGTLKGITALTPSSTVSLDPTLGDVFTLVPGQDETINAASVPATSQEITLIVTTSGSTSRTLTFGTNFKSTGTLATGVTTAKVFVIRFIGDGTNFNEVSRTTAM